MPDFPDANPFLARSRLIDGITVYKMEAGDECGYTDADIEQCVAIVDRYLGAMAAAQPLSQQQITDAVQKAVLDLNALNEKCDGGLIETDQREDLCEILLVTAAKAGLQTNEDITEQWREW